MRRAYVIWGLMLAYACAPVPKLVPAQGQEDAATTVTVRGVEARILANSWQGYPPWLTRRYTPVWIFLVNRGSESFDVTYSSLSLTNEEGEVNNAVPPQMVSRNLLGQRETDTDPALRNVDARNQQTTAPKSDSTPESPSSEPPTQWPPSNAPDVSPTETPTTPPTPATPQTPRHGYVFVPLPPYQYYWQRTFPGFEPIANGMGPVPPFSQPFGPSFSGRDASDVMTSAFTEGRLLPSTSAQGFVYFSGKASTKRLRFILRARNEAENGVPLEIKAEFIGKEK